MILRERREGWRKMGLDPRKWRARNVLKAEEDGLRRKRTGK